MFVGLFSEQNLVSSIVVYNSIVLRIYQRPIQLADHDDKC